MKTWICKGNGLISLTCTSASKHPTILKEGRLNLIIMEQIICAALLYEHWSQWDLIENWYWEERNNPEKSLFSAYKNQVSFQLRKKKKRRMKEKRKKQKEIQPLLSIWTAALKNTYTKFSSFPDLNSSKILKGPVYVSTPVQPGRFGGTSPKTRPLISLMFPNNLRKSMRVT